MNEHEQELVQMGREYAFAQLSDFENHLTDRPRGRLAQRKPFKLNRVQWHPSELAYSALYSMLHGGHVSDAELLACLEKFWQPA